MKRRTDRVAGVRRLLPLVLAGYLLAPLAAWPQVPAGATLPGRATLDNGELRMVDKQDWHVFGRVTTLDGEPVGGAKVRADVGGGIGSVKEIDTDLQGNFRTDFNLDAKQYSRLTVKLTVTKPGLISALETVDFGASDTTWEIDLFMRPKTEDPDQFSLESLVGTLGTRLRMISGVSAAARKDYSRGAALFLDQQDTERASPLLAKAIKSDPDCLECRTLLGLAYLQEGSLASANRQFAEAEKLNESRKPESRRPEPLIIAGELESWQRQDKKAGGFYTQALAISPSDPLALQEMGRIAIFQQSWQAADNYLSEAIKAGASADARLLDARALLEEGAAEEANEQMKTYLNGREPKELSVSARALYTELQDRLQLMEYGKVKSVVMQPPDELERAMPELHGLQPEASQDELAAILDKVGADVEAFFRRFPDTISLEQTRQERMGHNGKAAESLDQKFRYLLLARPEKWGLGLEEYRADDRGERTAQHGLEGGFMLTAGFASASLVFHPAYQSGTSFRYLG
ncbi:MAG TPA: tetratricopeptide repeat protein, partial [Terriglobia bacterium]|nr:tetratricopeptide repeat protein [Terriglobia bacterium]